jgi:hypothetical protein
MCGSHQVHTQLRKSAVCECSISHMVKTTVCISRTHRTPPRSDGLVNHVRRADSAVCDGLICTSECSYFTFSIIYK